ncbi:MAG: GNAT family N-acetyltransferase [Deltaproteobacteria bacterium]|nr:GNAT family N-acetyltransferase [Deltaproteobacteria bacterium]
MSATPTITTARLRLRGHRRDDLDAAAAMWGDPSVVRHIGGRPFGRSEVWARILRYVGHWDVMGYGFWAIDELATGAFVGEVGVAEFERSIDPPIGAYECGWVLAPAAHGRGFATEAVTAMLGWCDRTLAVPRVTCMIDEANAASLAVARKCGFREFARAPYDGDTAVLSERLRPDAIA